jgi:hypothetical protein
MARVDATFARNTPGGVGFKGAHVYPGSGEFGGGLQTTLPFDPPFTHAEFYRVNSDLKWHSVFQELVGATDTLVLGLEGGLNGYTAGATTTEVWNRPVSGPSHAVAAFGNQWIVRTGNLIGADVQLFGDSAGHPGRAFNLTTGEQVFFVDGTEVRRTAYPSPFPPTYEVPGGFRTFRLETTADRTAPVELSTRVSAVWTFKSDTTSGTSLVRMPIWSVALRPTLNADTNAAPRGVSFSLPATATTQPGSTAAGVTAFTVQYSTNDGTTWSNATVTGSGGNRTVTVTHPNAAGFVSLRATVTDGAGNSVTQTIIRAYKIA